MRQLSSVLIAVSVAPRNGGRSEYSTCYFPIRLWGWCSILVCRVQSDNRKTHFFRHNQWISQIANENYHTFRSTEFPGTRKRSRFSNRMRSLSKFGGSSATGQTESRNGAAEGHTSSAGRGGSRRHGPCPRAPPWRTVRGEGKKATEQQISFFYTVISYFLNVHNQQISYFLII